MIEHHDEDFTGREVPLDGRTFTGCTFRRSLLVFEATAMPNFIHCHFKEDVILALKGHAGGTVKLLDAIFHRGGESGRQAVERVFDHIRNGIFYHDRE